MESQNFGFQVVDWLFWARRQQSGTLMADDAKDASLAKKRLNESTARSLDFDAKVLNFQENETSGWTLEAKTTCVCEKLLERALDDDDWTRMKLPIWAGWASEAVTSQLETSFDVTMKNTRTQAERIEKSLTRKERDTN